MPAYLLFSFEQEKRIQMNILFVSLGCDKNRVDAECMLGLLTEHGYALTQSEEEADIIVVNTCCFIDEAKEESISHILELAQYKQGRAKLLIVAGCMAQRYKDEIISEIPEVDIVIGTTAYDRIIEAVRSALSGSDGERVLVDDLSKTSRTEAVSAGRPSVSSESPAVSRPTPGHRLLTTGGYYAYLKIAEGCDKNCTYCIIPSVRGHYRSTPMEELYDEALGLARSGVRELILVAQETTLYGVDLYGEKKLPALIRRLASIEQIAWIRLLYCYPEEITDELIELMRTEPKFCHYLDIPVQHASDPILKRMGRRTNRAQLESMVGRLRAAVPDICLRTTLISGFPGETRQDHERLLDFVERMRFDRLGVFTYSREEGTPAAAMDGQVKADVMEERRSELMQRQQYIAARNDEEQQNRKLLVLIEGRTQDDEDAVVSPDDYPYVGRTYRDAPGVDSVMYIDSVRELRAGDMIAAKVCEVVGYDLAGKEIADEYTE